jgi:hypothetical protein
MAYSSVCGSWPSFWTANLTQWPAGGEIDVVEGVNSQWYNHYALHATPTCVQSGQWQSGKIETSNCDNNAAGQVAGQGCGGTSTNSFGTYGFNWNQQGGGVYAVDWRKEGIRIWAFPRKSIPADILSGNPTTNGWGEVCSLSHSGTGRGKSVFPEEFNGSLWSTCRILGVIFQPTSTTTRLFLISRISLWHSRFMVAFAVIGLGLSIPHQVVRELAQIKSRIIPVTTSIRILESKA